MFGGYPRYLGVRLCEAWARVPRLLRAGPEALARRLLPDSPASRNLGDWARRFADGAARPMPERYVGWTRFFDAPALAALVTPALGHAFDGDVEVAHRAAWATRGHDDAVDGAWRVDAPNITQMRVLFPALVNDGARDLEVNTKQGILEEHRDEVAGPTVHRQRARSLACAAALAICANVMRAQTPTPVTGHYPPGQSGIRGGAQEPARGL